MYQKQKLGVIKPVKKSYYLSMEEEKLIQLKKMAAEQRTSIKALINNAIDEMYFKEVINDVYKSSINTR